MFATFGTATPAFAQLPIADNDSSTIAAVTALIGLFAALPGFALLAVARVPQDRITAVAARAVAAVAGIALLWVLVGFSLAFAPGTPALGGIGHALLGGNPDMGVVLIELALALAAGTIVAQGGGARATFGWSVGVAILWILIVYVPISWWLRGDGWLNALGAVDEGGGLTVHLAAGVSTLVLARIARAKADEATPVHPLPATVGGMLAWIGLLGLIAGASASASSDMAGAAVTALVASCAGALIRLAIDRVRSDTVSPVSALLGGIAGLAAVAAGAAYTGVLGAIVAGTLAGGLSATIAGIGDRHSLFTTHGIGGAVGALLLAFLFLPALGGPGYAEGATAFTAFTAEAVAIAAVIGWASIGSLIIGLGTAVVLPIREGEE